MASAATAAASAPSAAVQAVMQALDALYKDPNPQAKANANAWLQDFQKTPEAWETANTLLLAHDLPVEPRLFAAQTFRNKTTYDFEQVPPEARLALRSTLLTALSSYLAGPRVIQTQLCLTLASLALQLPDGADAEWGDRVIPAMTERYGSDPSSVPVLLEFLTALPEEIHLNHRIPVPDEQYHARVVSILSAHSAEVLKLLSMYIRAQGVTAQIQSAVFQCLRSWLKAGEVTASALLETPLFALSFEALASDSLFDVAVDVLCDLIAETQEVQENTAAIQQILPRLLPLRTELARAAADGDDDKVRGLCRLFVQAGETYHTLVLQHKADFLPLVQTIFDCARYHDLDIVQITFRFWYILANGLGKQREDPSNEPFIAIYRELLGIIMGHLRFGDDADSMPRSEVDEFRDFRHYMGDTLKDCCYVVGASECLGVALGRIQAALSAAQSGQASVRWQDLEAPLFSMRAMGREVDPRDDEVTPQIIDALPSLPRHPKLQYAALLVVCRYTEWVDHHPDRIPALLSYISQGLLTDPTAAADDAGSASSTAAAAAAAAAAVAETAPAAAQAFNFLCQDCRRHLPPLLPQLFEFFQRLIQADDAAAALGGSDGSDGRDGGAGGAGGNGGTMARLSTRDLTSVAEAIAYVVQDMAPPSRGQEALLRFTRPLLETVAHVAAAPPGAATKEQLATVAVRLEMLEGFLYVLDDRWARKGELPPSCAQTCAEAFGVLRNLIVAHGSRARVAERVCPVVRRGASLFGRLSHATLPVAFETLASAFADDAGGGGAGAGGGGGGHSAYVWTLGKLVDLAASTSGGAGTGSDDEVGRAMNETGHLEQGLEVAMQRAYERVSARAAAMLDAGDPREMPDMVADYVYTSSVIVEVSPSSVIGTPNLGRALRASLVALSFFDVDVVAPALRLLRGVVGHEVMQDDSEAASTVGVAAQQRYRHAILESLLASGPRLCESLVQGLVSHFAPETVQDVVGLLRLMCKELEANATAWIGAAVESLPPGQVAVQDRARFLESFTSAMSAKDLNGVRRALQALYDASRRARERARANSGGGGLLDVDRA